MLYLILGSWKHHVACCWTANRFLLLPVLQNLLVESLQTIKSYLSLEMIVSQESIPSLPIASTQLRVCASTQVSGLFSARLLWSIREGSRSLKRLMKIVLSCSRLHDRPYHDKPCSLFFQVIPQILRYKSTSIGCS